MEEDAVKALLQKFIAEIMFDFMKNNISFARQNNLSMSQVRTLFRLHQEGSSGVTEIGERLGITSPAVSQMLERLVQQGILQRTEATEDRRMKVIVLTDKGKELVRKYISLHHKWSSGLAESLTPEEKEKTAEVMQLLLEKAKLMKNTSEETRENKICCD
jgi:DNA-binding MarR family transcriptional regulator